MRKYLFTALVVAAGVASQAGAAWPPAYHITDQSTAPFAKIPTTKLGQLSISLANTFQLYTNWWGSTLYYGVNINPSRPAIPLVRPANRTWENNSYEYLSSCLGTVKYASLTKQINNVTLINAINAAFTTFIPFTGTPGGLFNTPGSGYTGAFNPATARIVVVNYNNLQQAPPYPPTEDNYSPTIKANVWNAPYNLQGSPFTGLDPRNINGQEIQLNWPNQNYIAWGKPSPYAGAVGNQVWIGARVFVLDPANANVNLRCFDVTPFFTLEEGFCWFCWDTMDRVTDGTVTRGSTTTISDPPCATGLTVSTCGISGSGVTYWYWTVKFNNVNAKFNRNPNYLLDWYYKGPRSFTGIDSGSLYFYGADLDDTKADQSFQGLAFTVSGIATYNWQFQTLSDGFNWSMGTISSAYMFGHGYSPMCGLFSGTVTIAEYDKTAAGFGGAWCLTP